MRLHVGVWTAIGIAAACAAGGAGDDGRDGPSDNLNEDDLLIDEDEAVSEEDIVTPVCTAACPDFDAFVGIQDEEAPGPSDAGARFAAVGASGPELCVVEPQAGSLFPANWLRPRFRFVPPAGATLFEIRLSTPNETSNFVMYTTRTDAVMPGAAWSNLAKNIHEQDILVSIRALNAGGSLVGVGSSSFRIAPVNARGAMVYWATTSTEKGDQFAWLDGFAVGEEGYVEALRVPQVEFSALTDMGANPKNAEFGASQGHPSCIGCHTSTPDGDAVVFVDHWPWGTAIASVLEESTGAVPEYVSSAGAALMGMAWLGIPTFSRSVWSPGQRIMVTSFGSTGPTGWGSRDSMGGDYSNQPSARLAWINLEASGEAPSNFGWERVGWAEGLSGTGFGFVAREGDSRGAIAPDWSNDGTTITYTSTTAGKDGRLEQGPADIYTVPWNDGQGGPATAVPGASDSVADEYYPSFSPDDDLIAFNRVSRANTKLYYNPLSEIHVVSASGGEPVRLAANDPPACTGITSPGIINSWAKWSPLAIPHGTRKYYFLIFSSARDSSVTIGGTPADARGSQLYMTAIVREGDVVHTYPAVFIWNQRSGTSNHTPAWDVFRIPPADIVK
jgi:hypothetical protein